jgi:hypothetical protein
MAFSVGTPSYFIRPQSSGKKMGLVDITFDASYATGGHAIAASDFAGLDNPPDVLIPFSDMGGVQFDWDDANNKIRAYYYDYDGGADGVAIEVAASTDLSGITAKFFFIGN